MFYYKMNKFIKTSIVCIYYCNSELWRKENTYQHNISSFKEELTKSDQILRSMAGKVIIT